MAASLDVGSVIRGARAAARMTQAQLGALCGYSGSAVSRMESNGLQLSREALLRVAEVLRIAPEQLGVTPHSMGRTAADGPVGAARVAGTVGRTQEDAVRRRQLLAGAVGVGEALAAGPASAEPRRAAADPAAALEAALYRSAGGVPVPLERLAGALGVARQDFTAAHYGALGQALPGLLGAAEATRDGSSGRARERAHAALARGYVLATELAVKLHADVAWATADRALTAARASGDPVVIGEAARVLAITMRRAGRTGAAVDLLRGTASSLGEQRGAAACAVEATLLMTAAYTAACGQDRHAAMDLMAGAEQAVERVPAKGPGVLFTVDATTAQADLYWIGVHNALGTPDEGARYAARIDPSALPTAERRARLGTDTARMWHQLGDHKKTFTALRMVEQAAPEEVRRPALRAMTADLLYGPVALPGMRDFARRTGAI